MPFLYDVPDWLMGVLIVVTIVGLSYAGYFLVRRVCGRSFTDEEKDVSMTVLQVVATINALLLAFVAVSVWESFDAAESAVVQEANSVAELGRDLAAFDSAQSHEARLLLREYADMVVKVEWPHMRRAASSTETWNAFDRMFHAIGQLEPDTPRRAAHIGQILAHADDLVDGRRTRLHTAEAAVPLQLWAVVLIGTMLTIATTVVLSPTRFNLTIIGLLALSMGLVFYLIVAMDRPYAGEQSISPAPFQLAVENMDRWDAEIAHK
jgi:Protein of unknown function (DUF4239)